MAVDLVPLPPRDAIAALFQRGKRLDPTFSWQDAWQEEHASMFTVAKSAGFDILTDIHQALVKALSEGTTFRDFGKQVKPILQAKGWWGRQPALDPLTGETRWSQLGSTRRLRAIFDTNMRVSYATGHWASFERNKAARPYLRYVAILDEATRPAHRARHNLVLPVDHPYWNLWAPPCGWGCRCTLQQLSQRDVDRLTARGEKLFFEPPVDTFRNFVNRRTGEISRVPDGIDPGWAYNPGKAGHRAALGGSSKLVGAPPEMAAAVYDDPDWLLKPLGEEFAKWFDAAAAGGPGEQDMVVIGALDRAVLSWLDANGERPQSGAITIRRGVVQHMLRDAKAGWGKQVPQEVLRRMPELLAAPRAVLRDKKDGSLLYIFDVPGETRAGKIVIRVDFDQKMRGRDGRRTTVATNAVRTATLVDPTSLADRASFELLSGSL